MRKYILKTYLSLLLVVIITLSLYHSPTQGSLVDIEPVWENINRSGGEVYIQDEYIVVTSNLKCFDKDTGDIIWDEVKYNGEVVKYIKDVFDVDNGVIIALYSTNTVLGISVLDGNVLWSYPFEYDVLCAKATKDVLVCSFNIKSEHHNTPRIMFIDLDDGNKTWYSGYGHYDYIRTEQMFIVEQKCYLLLSGIVSEIVCIDTRSVKEQWHAILNNIDYRPVLVDDKFYYLSDDTLYSLDSYGKKTEIITGIESHGFEIVDVTEKGILTISYDPGMYFFDGPDSVGLFYNSAEDGRLIWKYEWDPYADTKYLKSISSIPYVFDDIVYLAGIYSLFRIDLESGMYTLVAEILKNNISSRESNIKVLDDLIYVAGESGTSCFRLEDIINTMEIRFTFQINESFYFTSNGISRFMDVSPQIINSRTLLPARYVVEPLGGQVFWDGEQRKVTCKLVVPDNADTDEYKENIVELWIDNPIAKVNGEEVQIDPHNPDVTPTIIDDRTFVPVRFLAESLGCEVEWIADTKEIILTYSP